MLPIEIIAIMKSKGWLRKEPANVREQITSAVRYLMISTGMSSVQQLSEYFPEVSPAYIRRKVSEHRWRMDDLDLLPEVFHDDDYETYLYQAADFVQGYRRMAELDNAERAAVLKEEEQHTDG